MEHIPEGFAVVKVLAGEVNAECVLAKNDKDDYSITFIDTVAGNYITYPRSSAKIRQRRIDEHLAERPGLPMIMFAFPGAAKQKTFELSPEFLAEVQAALLYELGPV